MAIQTTAVIDPKYNCASCGGSFLGDEGYDDGGAFVCVACFQRRSAVAPPSKPRVPGYEAILKGAAVLQGYATLLMVAAFIAFGMGALVACLALVNSKEAPGAAFLVATVSLAGGLLGGLIYLIFSRLVRMLAELAIAHRDIARNSFR